MKGRKFLIPVLLFFFLLTSCNDEPEQENDLWVGTYRGLDRNIPFPFLIVRTKEGLQLINHRNELIDSTAEFHNQFEVMDTLRMQDHEFLVTRTSPDLLLFDIRDSLNFPIINPLYSAQFIKAGAAQEIELASLAEKLQVNTYQSEVESAHFATPNRDLKVIKTMEFSEDSVQTTYRYFYNEEPVYAEKEMAGFRLFERKGKVFFSTTQELDKAQTLYQITEVDEESFSLRTFRENEEITERLQVAEEPERSEDIRVFERCMGGLPGEYYHDDLTYIKGNEFLIRKIGESAPQASGDGYITVHFTINCKGEMGHPGLEQMDREFQSTSFDPAFVQHIITEVMNLQDWPEIEAGTFYKDIHSFLMFRIRNGKITDLCP